MDSIVSPFYILSDIFNRCSTQIIIIEYNTYCSTRCYEADLVELAENDA